ncbi:MAG TPA: PilT/PilU family type 4a pilus ATPase [Labilithrix sp.]|nr:PilT/PilU family type 4a pilus ATPase [Labilithrix sp.]
MSAIGPRLNSDDAPAPPPSIDPTMRTLLEHMLRVNASDLYLTNESPPTFRVDGECLAGKQPATAEHIQIMADSLMTPEQQLEFRTKLEMNLAIAIDGGRFRVNVFRQRGAPGMVVRLVKTRITTLDELGHPQTLKDVVSSKRGLILLVGGTGSGKSTTLAAMIDHRNTNMTGHIVTVEDPVEFIHPHKRCVVTQREVGVDTLSYASALKNTLRQAPDVILIGEIRDAETMEAALAFAETGHLCLSTLHSNSADQAVERILSFFPSDRHHEILMQLSLNLRAVISQRLLPSVDGGRAAALEILLDTPRIKDLIKRGEIHVLKDAMEQSVVDGCQTFDAALYELCATGKITEEDAMKNADSANNLRLRLERLRSGRVSLTGGSLRLAGEVPKRAASGIMRAAYLTGPVAVGAEVPPNVARR